MNIPFIKVFPDLSATVDLLSDAEAGRLLKALLHYGNGGEDELLGQEKLVFAMLKAQMDRDAASYADYTDKQRKNGQKGGRPKKPTETQQNPKNPSLFLKTQKSQDKEEDKDKDEEEDEDKDGVGGAKAPQARARRFTPPTVGDVRLYCEERRNGVDPQRFVDFYASKGWKVGSQAMKDWRACVRTWEQRDNASPSSGCSPGYVRPENPKNHYEQRTYTDDELERIVGTDELLRAAREAVT